MSLLLSVDCLVVDISIYNYFEVNKNTIYLYMYFIHLTENQIGLTPLIKQAGNRRKVQVMDNNKYA